MFLAGSSPWMDLALVKPICHIGNQGIYSSEMVSGKWCRNVWTSIALSLFIAAWSCPVWAISTLLSSLVIQDFLVIYRVFTPKTPLTCNVIPQGQENRDHSSQGNGERIRWPLSGPHAPSWGQQRLVWSIRKKAQELNFQKMSFQKWNCLVYTRVPRGDGKVGLGCQLRKYDPAS